MIAVQRFGQEVTITQNKPKVLETGHNRKIKAANCLGAFRLGR